MMDATNVDAALLPTFLIFVTSQWRQRLTTIAYDFGLALELPTTQVLCRRNSMLVSRGIFPRTLIELQCSQDGVNMWMRFGSLTENLCLTSMAHNKAVFSQRHCVW